ncbi:tyrosine-type recombinase/integrase [Thermodesulfobacteriota bacterium]
MGVYQRYKDKRGILRGPWFVKYPYSRDSKTGKIQYRIKKASSSKRLAEKFLREREDEFFRRDEQGLALEEPQRKIKLAQLVDWYLGQDVVKVKRSYRNDLQRGRVLVERFGHLLADEITQTQVRNFQVQRQREKTWRGEPVKSATVNREVALMRAAYYLGIDEGLVSKNPCRKIKMLKENNNRDRVLTCREFDALCGELTPVARRVVKTACHSGMRKGEMLGLSVKKINLEEHCIDLEEDDTKDHERRRIYFGEELCEVLKECLDVRKELGVNHKYVFVRENGKPVRSIRTAFENACRRVGLEGFHFHDLRHTYNTDMRRAGVHHSVIMKQTGHATMQMFLRYNTVDESDARQAVRRRAEYLQKQRSDCSQCAP